MHDFGHPQRVENEASQALWDDIRDVSALSAPGEAVIWRCMLPADKSAAFVAQLRTHMAVRALYDWAGGLVWLSLAATDGGVEMIRRLVKSHSGHATLVRASETLRRDCSPFEPPSPAVAKLARGLKHAFDPAGILNPGRIYAEA